MEKQKIKFIVTHRASGNEFVTYAVSEKDAINNIHFKLWFQRHIWTEMSDFYAVSEAVLKLKAIKKLAEQEKEQEKQEPSYHQMTLFEVAV